MYGNLAGSLLRKIAVAGLHARLESHEYFRVKSRVEIAFLVRFGDYFATCAAHM